MLDKLVSELHALRLAKAGLDDSIFEAKTKVQQTPEAQRVRQLQQQMVELEESLKRKREEITQEALEAYRLEPNNKHPGAGVGIRVESEVQYDPVQAEAWCWQHYTLAFQLNEKMFVQQMRLMRRNESTTPLPPFVKFVQQVNVNIASNLEPYYRPELLYSPEARGYPTTLESEPYVYPNDLGINLPITPFKEGGKADEEVEP